MRRRFLHLSVADFIDNEQMGSREHPHFLLDGLVLISLLQHLHQIVGRDEVDRIPMLDRFQRQSDRQMRFPRSRRAKKNEIFKLAFKPIC